MTDAKRVPIWGKPQGYVTVEPGATVGAVFGVNLRWPNGSLVKLTDFEQTATETGGSQFSYWIQIADVPANVKGIAALTGTGVVRKTGDGAFDTATTTTDLPEGTNLYHTTERAQDAVGAAIAAGTGDGVTLTYDDSGNKINAANTDKGSVAVASHEAATDPHPQYLTQAEGDARYALSGAGLVLTASGAISALRMIVAEGGSGRYPDTSVAADAGRVVGMSTTSAASGDPFDVLTQGEHVDAGWSWSPGPVFCGASGALTQSPGTGWVLEVGRALSATRLLVDVKTPLIRS